MVTSQTVVTGAAEMTHMVLRFIVQSLSINLDSEKSEGQFGEQPEGGGDGLSHAHGTDQQDPAAPGGRRGPDPCRGSAPGPGGESLLTMKVKLEAKIATYCGLLEEGEDFNLGDTLDKTTPYRPPLAELRPKTLKF